MSLTKSYLFRNNKISGSNWRDDEDAIKPNKSSIRCSEVIYDITLDGVDYMLVLHQSSKTGVKIEVYYYDGIMVMDDVLKKSIIGFWNGVQDEKKERLARIQRIKSRIES